MKSSWVSPIKGTDSNPIITVDMTNLAVAHRTKSWQPQGVPLREWGTQVCMWDSREVEATDVQQDAAVELHRKKNIWDKNERINKKRGKKRAITKASRIFLPEALGLTAKYTACHPPSKWWQLATLLCNANCGSLIAADGFILLLTAAARQIRPRKRTDLCMFLHFTEVLVRNVTRHTWTIILFLSALLPSPSSSCHEAGPMNHLFWLWW